MIMQTNMATIPSLVHSHRASTVKTVFNRETTVTIEIKATPSIIWALLTNASDFPRWNHTVISIDGNIAPEEIIKLKSTLDPNRTFKLKVKEFHPENKLVWGDTMGNRIYSINKNENGSSLFSMSEKIGGPLFPLFAKMIPSFDNSFNQFATDLKAEAEFKMNSKYEASNDIFNT
jgi:uncharacterized protein YndB with AHSA1/START domain